MKRSPLRNRLPRGAKNVVQPRVRRERKHLANARCRPNAPRSQSVPICQNEPNAAAVVPSVSSDLRHRLEPSVKTVLSEGNASHARSDPNAKYALSDPSRLVALSGPVTVPSDRHAASALSNQAPNDLLLNDPIGLRAASARNESSDRNDPRGPNESERSRSLLALSPRPLLRTKIEETKKLVRVAVVVAAVEAAVDPMSHARRKRFAKTPLMMQKT